MLGASSSCLTKGPADGAWPALRVQSHCKDFVKDAIIYREGNAASHFWWVVSGWVKLVRHTPDGQEIIVDLCAAGETLGEEAFLATPYGADAVAITPTCTVASISTAVVQELIRNRILKPEFITEQLQQRLQGSKRKHEQVCSMITTQRVGCFLLHLHDTQSPTEMALTLPIEKHVIATYLGMKPESFSRSLLQLKAHGVTVRGNVIAIHDKQKLYDYVCVSCAQYGDCGDSLQNG